MERGLHPARHLLSGALAALGPGAGAARPGAAARYAGAARVFLLGRDLAAGGLLPGGAADPRRDRPVPGDLAAGPRLVWVHLPADGLDRSLHASRALDPGRPERAHETRQGTLVAAQAASQGDHAC